ncbi:MAG: hypothetical protein Q9164_004587 [Protoblastenia rupestris]
MTKSGSRPTNRAWDADETPHAEYPEPFDFAEKSKVTDSVFHLGDDATDFHFKKRLTAIQEMAYDAEAAEEYLRKDRQSQLLMSFNPEIRDLQRRHDVGEIGAEALPVIEPAVDNIRKTQGSPDSVEAASCTSFATGRFMQPTHIEQNSMAIPCIYGNHKSPLGDPQLSDNYTVRENENQMREPISHTVKYGISSEDDGLSLARFGLPVLEGSPWDTAQVHVDYLMKKKSQARYHLPAPYPSSSPMSSNHSTHAGDLVHHSPGLGRKYHPLSLLTSEFERPGASSKPDQPSHIVTKTAEASASIPNISTQHLSSLSAQEKEKCLEEAIIQAKLNSENTGIPFLIMRDGRSCVVSCKKQEIEFINSPEEWKKSMLAELNTHSNIFMQSSHTGQMKRSEQQGSSWEEIQKARWFSTSHNSPRNNTHDTTHGFIQDVYQSYLPVPENSSLLLRSFSNDKAHRTLGIIGDTVVAPSSRGNQQPRENGVSNSSTDAISIITFPPGSIVSGSMLEKSTSAPPSRYGRGSPNPARNTSRQVGLQSPDWYGEHSPSCHREVPPTERQFPLQPAQLPNLTRAASFLSDGSRDCPVKASFEDVSASAMNGAYWLTRVQIGRAVTTPDEPAESKTMSENDADAASISSSTYRGDDACVEAGQRLRIYDFLPSGSTKSFEKMGLMETKKEERKAEEKASLTRAGARFTPQTGEAAASLNRFPSHGHDGSNAYAEKETIRWLKDIRGRKPAEDAVGSTPIEKTVHPFASMQRAYKLPVGGNTEDASMFMEMNHPMEAEEYSSSSDDDITSATALKSNAPTQEDLAHACAITERHKVLNEKKRLEEERRIGEERHSEDEMTGQMSDTDSAKDVKAFGRSPDRAQLIILIRHAQSEGNKNRDIHQTIPDHRVKLTPDGWKQAEEAGLKLRSLLLPSDTLHFFTSPYRRTRETTEGILNSLTSSSPTPSPFPRHTIKVYEEPRLREQDFGNFQPNSAEMARMWQERADYGHFFYRIPNGESAADAYDRVSGFNESLWRSFGEEDFASVCVLVTHGLMTRVFLMKWYHFSVEYFEDLRNVNHCEFVVMKLNEGSGKYILQNQLRTWSELRRERENEKQEPQSPIPIRKKWGGCQEGDGNRGDDFARRQAKRRQNTVDLFTDDYVVGSEGKVAAQQDDEYPGPDEDASARTCNARSQPALVPIKSPSPASRNRTLSPNRLQILKAGRDGGGSRSGATSPNLAGSDDSDGDAKEHVKSLPRKGALAMALNHELDFDGSKGRVRADALGDQSDVEDEEEGAAGA